MIRSTLFCKGASARFTARCGCTLSHSFTPYYSATVDPCDNHYEAGMEPMSLRARRDTDVVTELSCGCSLDHKGGGSTAWVLCAEDQEEFDRVNEGLGFMSHEMKEN